MKVIAMIQMSKFIKWFLMTAGLILLMPVVLYGLVILSIRSDVFAVDTFDPRVWHAATTDEEDMTCYRGGMAEDIQNNVLSRGMTKEEVVALLGVPDGSSTDNEYQYVLGMCSGIDYDNLHVYFDDQGRFFQAKIIQH